MIPRPTECPRRFDPEQFCSCKSPIQPPFLQVTNVLHADEPELTCRQPQHHACLVPTLLVVLGIVSHDFPHTRRTLHGSGCLFWNLFKTPSVFFNSQSRLVTSASKGTMEPRDEATPFDHCMSGCVSNLYKRTTSDKLRILWEAAHLFPTGDITFEGGELRQE